MLSAKMHTVGFENTEAELDLYRKSFFLVIVKVFSPIIISLLNENFLFLLT